MGRFDAPDRLRHLSDVGAASPDDGDVLVWDASAGMYLPGRAGSGERLVQDGASPPVELTLEDESDYLYEDI